MGSGGIFVVCKFISDLGEGNRGVMFAGGFVSVLQSWRSGVI